MSETKEKAEDRYRFNGRRVRAWCTDEGIKLEDLAEKLDIPFGTLKSWVYNNRNISFNQACAIADAFGKPVDDLMIRLCA